MKHNVKRKAARLAALTLRIKNCGKMDAQRNVRDPQMQRDIWVWKRRAYNVSNASCAHNQHKIVNFVFDSLDSLDKPETQMTLKVMALQTARQLGHNVEWHDSGAHGPRFWEAIGAKIDKP